MDGNRFGSTRRLLLGCLGALLIACGGPGETTSGSANARTGASLEVGDPIPAASKEDVVLEMSGAIDVTNAGGSLSLNLETLEQMPVVEATLYEPFVEQDMTFGGILLSDLFRYAGAESAIQVEMTALDDYRVTFPIDKLQADRTLLATRAEGKTIGIEEGGPIRIVFLDEETQFGPTTDNWIWSVSSMAFSR